MTALLPHDLVTLNGRLFVHWLDPGTLDLSPGFFREAIQALPDKHRFAAVTSFTTLLDTVIPAVQAAGLIFHTSRCGSTLVCQMLKQHPDLVVLGEPTLLNQIVRSAVLSREQKIRALQQSIGLFAHWARETGRRLIIKLSCWNVLIMDLYREAATCPTLYLYRHYLPVLESLLRKPPRWLAADLLPSLSIAGNVQCDRASTVENPSLRLDLLSRSGHSYLQFIVAIDAALAHHGQSRLLGYESVLSRLAELLLFFELPFYEAVSKNMARAARLDAKSGECFAPREARIELQQLETTLKVRYPTLAKQLDVAYDGLQTLEKQRFDA